MVEVTQADKDAAAVFQASWHAYDTPLEKAFAAHREAGHRAGLEEAAGIARKYDCRGNNDSARNMAAIIRNAIRAKIGEDHD